MKKSSWICSVIEIAVSKDDKKVFADLEKGHAATHIADDAHLLGLVREAVRSRKLDADEVRFEHIFDYVIGECDLQAVDDGDEILYAVRKQRDRYTKFVKNKPRHQCSSVTIILKKTRDGYELISAWIGHLVPSFPRMKTTAGQDTLEKQYWATHALVWGRQVVDGATVTTECPWRD